MERRKDNLKVRTKEKNENKLKKGKIRNESKVWRKK